ncbi:hypothetical protein BDZ89DRAFT_517912 [Hymenopellis radicata]|nr:hypothetical protein BDZ89DRAFT_517912 [Hymenopellis radicata]
MLMANIHSQRTLEVVDGLRVDLGKFFQWYDLMFGNPFQSPPVAWPTWQPLTSPSSLSSPSLPHSCPTTSNISGRTACRCREWFAFRVVVNHSRRVSPLSIARHHSPCPTADSNQRTESPTILAQSPTLALGRTNVSFCYIAAATRRAVAIGLPPGQDGGGQRSWLGRGGGYHYNIHHFIQVHVST